MSTAKTILKMKRLFEPIHVPGPAAMWCDYAPQPELHEPGLCVHPSAASCSDKASTGHSCSVLT